MTRFVSRLPIKITVPLILALPVLVVVAVLSVVAFMHSRWAVNDLADQNMDQIHSRIEEHLSQLMDMPPAINRLNQRMLATGELSLSDVDRNRVPVFETLQTFQAVSSVVIGKATGETMWVIRYPGETTYEYAIKRSPEASMEEYALGDAGRLVGGRLSRYTFHPTLRPWYKAAIAADGPAWGDVYVWVRNGQGETLGIPYVEPCRDAAGDILGVINCELTLADISVYLHRLQIGKTGKAFIVERSGDLVSTSVGIPCMKDGVKRLPATEASDPWIAQASAQLATRFESLNAISQRRRMHISADGRPMRLVVSPYRNRDSLHWLIVTLVPEQDFMAAIVVGRRRSIAAGASAVIATVLFGVILGVLMVRPFLSLVSQLRTIGGGNLDKEVHLDQTPEFTQISLEINKMVSGLRERMNLRHSLALAMEVQQNLLPSDSPIVEGLDIAGHSTYCDETGGDYYDFLDVVGLSDTTAAIAIGDVAGHGIASAMLMATARGILLSHCDETDSLSDLLTHMNGHLATDLSSSRFMTMLLMTIDAKLGEMRWGSAGHDLPIVYDSQSDQFVEIDGGGIPLGVVDDYIYEEYLFGAVKSGQIYLAATDGVWETFDQQGRMFGRDRVREFVRANAQRSASEIADLLRAELSHFRGEHPQDDDVTFVIVRVL